METATNVANVITNWVLIFGKFGAPALGVSSEIRLALQPWSHLPPGKELDDAHRANLAKMMLSGPEAVDGFVHDLFKGPAGEGGNFTQLVSHKTVDQYIADIVAGLRFAGPEAESPPVDRLPARDAVPNRARL